MARHTKRKLRRARKAHKRARRRANAGGSALMLVGIGYALWKGFVS